MGTRLHLLGQLLGQRAWGLPPACRTQNVRLIPLTCARCHLRALCGSVRSRSGGAPLVPPAHARVAWTNTEPTSVRHRQRHAGYRGPVLLRVHLPIWGSFLQALSERTVPWGPLSFTVLAQAPMWHSSCPASRVLGFACTNTEPTSVRHRQRHADLRGPVLLRALGKLGKLRLSHRRTNGALGSALFHRAGASSDVALLVSAVACTGLRVHQHRTNKRAPPTAPRCSDSACLVACAHVKLGRLHLSPRQANGALVSALLDRAGANSDVALLVSAVACTGFRVHQHRTDERSPSTAHRWLENTCLVACARAKLEKLHVRPRQANNALSSAILDRAGTSSDVALLVSAVACTGFRVHQHRTNEYVPPLAPRCSHSACLVACARVKLGKLRLSPRKANGALGLALLDRAGVTSYVALLLSAAACAGFRVHQHRTNECAPPLAPRWSERACLVACAPAKLGILCQALDKRTVHWVPLSLTVLAQAPMWRCSCPPLRVLGFACTNTEPASVRKRCATLVREDLSCYVRIR